MLLVLVLVLMWCPERIVSLRAECEGRGCLRALRDCGRVHWERRVITCGTLLAV